MMGRDDGRCDFGDYYAGVGGSRVFRWLDRAKKRVAKGVLENLAGKGRVLDLGCGSAAISGYLAQIFPDVDLHAADSNEALLEVAARRGLKTERVDFDQDLPYDAESFDVVFMIDTIEHVQCRTKTMAQVKRVIRKDGKLVVFTPPYDSITWLVGERLFTLLTGRPADHICPFTRESLEWLLRRHFAHSTIQRFNFGLTMCGIGWEKKE